MRNLKLFFGMALAFGAVCLTSCKSDNPSSPVNVVEDGFYVVGNATTIADLTVDGASVALMAPGINENGQVARDGMYEKYVALLGGKSFSIVLKAGTVETQYGATLASEDLPDDGNQPPITILRGVLTANGSLQVAENGLYHIIVDLNTDHALANPTIIIAPVTFGVRGAMNGWGFTAFSSPTFNQTSMTYTMTNVQVETGGGWKFAYGGGWKIILNPEVTDDNAQIRANTNLGNDATDDNLPLIANGMKPGGKNIGIDRAVYTITLTWNLKGGDVKESFVASLTKTGDLEVLDPTTFIYSLIGDAVFVDGEQTNWDADLDMPYVGNTGNTYTFKATNATLGDGEFKVRFNHDWAKSFGLGEQDGNVFNLVNNGSNMSHSGVVTYSEIIFTFDWDAANQTEVNPTLTLVP